jgi:hypothetical protein
MKVPPYGRPLKTLLSCDLLLTNSVYLYIGENAWEDGKMSSICRPMRTLVLPPHTSPLLYEWPVYGCDIMIIETTLVPTTEIEHLVKVLFSYGATGVSLVSVDFSSTFYKKDF